MDKYRQTKTERWTKTTRQKAGRSKRKMDRDGHRLTKKEAARQRERESRRTDPEGEKHSKRKRLNGITVHYTHP